MPQVQQDMNMVIFQQGEAPPHWSKEIHYLNMFNNDWFSDTGAIA
jgi:hypothetical protein